MSATLPAAALSAASTDLSSQPLTAATSTSAIPGVNAVAPPSGVLDRKQMSHGVDLSTAYSAAMGTSHWLETRQTRSMGTEVEFTDLDGKKRPGTLYHCIDTYPTMTKTYIAVEYEVKPGTLTEFGTKFSDGLLGATTVQLHGQEVQAKDVWSEEMDDYIASRGDISGTMFALIEMMVMRHREVEPQMIEQARAALLDLVR